MKFRILTTLGLLCLFLIPAMAIEEDFSENEIENEEALANSDAAIAEKKELKNLKESEKKRAAQEQAAAAKAKQQAKEVARQASKESDALMRDVKVWRQKRKGFEADRKVSEKQEAGQRRQIEKIKIEREKEQALFDQGKKALEDAKTNYRASVDLFKTLKSDLEKMKRDRQKMAVVTKNINGKTADLNKRNQALEQRIQAGTKMPAAVKAKPAPTPARSSATVTKTTKLGQERILKQDCNLRLGPSSKAEVYKILRKGEPVLFHGMEGIWYAVGTKEIEKAYLSKPCL